MRQGSAANWDRGSASPAASRWQPIALLLVAMVSIQSGASLAKHLFPAVGATGATALRLALATLLLVAVFRPWRMRVQRHQWPALLAQHLHTGHWTLDTGRECRPPPTRPARFACATGTPA